MLNSMYVLLNDIDDNYWFYYPDLLGNYTTFTITVRIDKDNTNIIICDNNISMNKES